MRKIKQSFTEVVAGQPRKEHYLNVTLVVFAITIAAGAIITLAFTVFNVQK